MTRVPIKRVYQATFYFKDQNPLPCLENSILSFLGLLHFHLVSTSCLFPTLRPSFIFLIYHTVFSARNILLFLLLTPSSLRPTEALLPQHNSQPHIHGPYNISQEVQLMPPPQTTYTRLGAMSFAFPYPKSPAGCLVHTRMLGNC